MSKVITNPCMSCKHHSVCKYADVMETKIKKEVEALNESLPIICNVTIECTKHFSEGGIR